MHRRRGFRRCVRRREGITGSGIVEVQCEEDARVVHKEDLQRNPASCGIDLFARRGFRCFVIIRFLVSDLRSD
ncbi:hypothetical protein U1Q18_036152 [Sarracenia purpurea var. burkii]